MTSDSREPYWNLGRYPHLAVTAAFPDSEAAKYVDHISRAGLEVTVSPAFAHARMLEVAASGERPNRSEPLVLVARTATEEVADLIRQGRRYGVHVVVVSRLSHAALPVSVRAGTVPLHRLPRRAPDNTGPVSFPHAEETALADGLYAARTGRTEITEDDRRTEAYERVEREISTMLDHVWSTRGFTLRFDY